MTLRGILVTDFDGTMTATDFYTLVAERLAPREALRHWAGYESGEITHFEALRRIFAEMRSTPAQMDAVLRDMALDPGAADAVARLRAAGWRVVVASAGCGWYVERLLAGAGIDVEVHSNPGTMDERGALVMRAPVESRFFHPGLGVDKSGIVRAAMEECPVVAFAGDGRPDIEPALLVPAERRFARGVLASLLRARGERFQPYPAWSAIADALVGHRTESAS